MSSLNLKSIYKVYPNGVVAVSDFNLDIEDKEFIVFVGPSGCGKSTTLRMIAGLEEISAGELYIDGNLVNNVAPKDRDIAMVFQNYALYPHMTVYDNMAFGLKLRKMPKPQIDARVKEAAKILGIEQYLSRKPKALSGGQRQRVALGRAIVREPKVFLLDEPLSNLDAKLRSQMRTEITKLHNRLATTFIYVTHDQVEAMTMGTRIVVMKDGFMQQVDTPMNLYNYPINKFVAGFIGTPQMNFFEGTLMGTKTKVYFKFGEDKILLPKAQVNNIYDLDAYLNTGKEVTFGIRPEDVKEGDDGVNPTINVKVDVVEALGSETLIYCKTKDKQNEGLESVVEDVSNLIAKVGFAANAKPGENVTVSFDVAHSHIFDKETEITIVAKTADDKAAIALMQEEKKAEIIRREEELAAKQAEEEIKRAKKLAKKAKAEKEEIVIEETVEVIEEVPAEEKTEE